MGSIGVRIIIDMAYTTEPLPEGIRWRKIVPYWPAYDIAAPDCRCGHTFEDHDASCSRCECLMYDDPRPQD